jgi:hypothetical protein
MFIYSRIGLQNLLHWGGTYYFILVHSIHTVALPEALYGAEYNPDGFPFCSPGGYVYFATTCPLL